MRKIFLLLLFTFVLPILIGCNSFESFQRDAIQTIIDYAPFRREANFSVENWELIQSHILEGTNQIEQATTRQEINEIKDNTLHLIRGVETTRGLMPDNATLFQVLYDHWMPGIRDAHAQGAIHVVTIDDVAFYFIGWFNDDIIVYIPINPVVFQWPSDNTDYWGIAHRRVVWIYVWHNGNTYRLQAAHELGLLTPDDLDQVRDVTIKYSGFIYNRHNATQMINTQGEELLWS